MIKMIKRVNFEIDEDLWNWLKSRAVLKNKTLSQYVTDNLILLKKKIEDMGPILPGPSIQGGQFSSVHSEDMADLTPYKDIIKKAEKKTDKVVKKASKSGVCIHGISTSGFCEPCSYEKGG